jgi:hypothetical protein
MEKAAVPGIAAMPESLGSDAVKLLQENPLP